MTQITKIRARSHGDRTQVLVLVPHLALAGDTEDLSQTGSTGAIHVEEMRFHVNAREVAVADFGPNVPQDLLTAISLAGCKVGDRVAVTWRGSDGTGGGAETVVK